MIVIAIVAVVTHTAIQKIPIQKEARKRERSLILKRSRLINIKRNEMTMYISTDIKRGVTGMKIQIRIVTIEIKKLKLKIGIEISINNAAK